MTREVFLLRTFVELADALVDDFDVVDLMTLLADRCVEGLEVSAAGIMVANVDGELRVVASSTDAMRVLQLFELQVDEGPCPECYRTREPINSGPLAYAIDRWPKFAPRAIEGGFHSVHALPMRMRSKVIGALNLFCATEVGLDEQDLAAAQAFADVATIALLQHRAVAEAQAINEQLTTALNSRIAIEQAKGMVAEATGTSVEEAFIRLRGHARTHNLRLVDLARTVIDGTVAPASLEERRAETT